ncbi:hypothetical protein [Sphingobium sp. TCM1]|uniref:hypothetical protein n=1 Tax=Sphingobium sp. TCM1 TaxID=453246 RepID=UPI0007F44F67|nr:hypothetical protein [Sphingobium sp. TCM1]OAN58629.1 hypothetical protein A7Q26_13350 [Sphingobium sp. TCM1]
MNPDHDDGFEAVFEASTEIDALLAYARGLNNQALGIAEVAHAIVTVIEAERRFARVSYTILVTTSMVVAALFAFMAASSLRAPLQGAIVVGICAGMGAGSTGLILVPWDALARHVRSVARRWRRP